MPELPSSVRVALWVTRAWADGTPIEEILPRALPDVHVVTGDVERLATWREFGESALLVALPAAGDITGLPATSPEALDEAVAAGEALVAPGLGGLLVPDVRTFGSELEPGTLLEWHAHDAQPVPRHRVEALDAGELERQLRTRLERDTAVLDAIGGQPFGAGAARELADNALGARWGLPPGIPPRAQRVIHVAATVSLVARLGLEVPDGALVASIAAQREDVLRGLLRAAERTLADATNAASAALAGWVPAR